MARIGVFVCHCGENISATVDCGKVKDVIGDLKHVAFSTEYKYMCSDPGQTLIKDAIKEHNLTGVVVSACSPRMHEPTFFAVSPIANPIACVTKMTGILYSVFQYLLISDLRISRFE